MATGMITALRAFVSPAVDGAEPEWLNGSGQQPAPKQCRETGRHGDRTVVASSAQVLGAEHREAVLPLAPIGLFRPVVAPPQQGSQAVRVLDPVPIAPLGISRATVPAFAAVQGGWFLRRPR